MKNKKEKDDDQVIANMNVEGMPWYDPIRAKREKEGKPLPDYPKISEGETWDLIFAIYRYLLPVVLIIIAIFAVVILLIGHPWNT